MSYRRASVKRRRRFSRLLWVLSLRPSVAYALGVSELRRALIQDSVSVSLDLSSAVAAFFPIDTAGVNAHRERGRG